MTPPAEGQEKDVLLVLDKQQGKVSAVKGIDKDGNLHQFFLPGFESCRFAGPAGKGEKAENGFSAYSQSGFGTGVLHGLTRRHDR